MTWNIEEFRAYNAMLHVNIKLMMSQQRWYLLLSYFNNKINFLFSSENWNSFLMFAFRSVWHMLSKYSTKQYVIVQYCAKQMSQIWCKNIQAFLRYSNFCVGIFYFALPCNHCHMNWWLFVYLLISFHQNCMKTFRFAEYLKLCVLYFTSILCF